MNNVRIIQAMLLLAQSLEKEDMSSSSMVSVEKSVNDLLSQLNKISIEMSQVVSSFHDQVHNAYQPVLERVDKVVNKMEHIMKMNVNEHKQMQLSNQREWQKEEIKLRDQIDKMMEQQIKQEAIVRTLIHQHDIAQKTHDKMMKSMEDLLTQMSTQQSTIQIEQLKKEYEKVKEEMRLLAHVLNNIQ